MLIQSVQWCNDKNVMLFIRLHRSSPPPPMTLFMHVLSDLLPKNFLASKQYRVFNLFLKSMGTQENQNAEKLERERTVGAGISYLIQKSYEATAICGITKLH